MVRRLADRGNDPSKAKSSFSKSEYSAPERCLPASERRDAEERPDFALLVSGWSLAPVLYSSVNPTEPTRGRLASAASPAKRPVTVQSEVVAGPRLPCSPLPAANQCSGGQWAAGPGVR